MASDKTSDPSIQQYNVSHSDVIIHSSAIVLVTFNSFEFNFRCSDNRRTSRIETCSLAPSCMAIEIGLFVMKKLGLRIL